MPQHRFRAPCQHHLALECLEPRLTLSGMGLTAQYFHNADFTGVADIRTEDVSHNWGSGSPGSGIDADSFSIRWTGQILPEFSETYTFRVLSDEGVRVWVDGQLLIDDFTPHPRRYREGTIDLDANQLYDIRVDYFEISGTAQIDLIWGSASQPLEIIPTERLFESPPGLWGTYSDLPGNTLSRVDPVIDFDWGHFSPGSGIAPDGFTAKWSGQIRADFSEQYTFSTISDQRVRLQIGNELIIDNWVDHTATEDQGSKLLEAGKWYDIRLDYYETTGPAEIELRWSSPRQTGEGQFEVVPQEALRAMKPTAVTFENPLGVGADPYVTQWQGNYYMTMTTDGRSVSISRAPLLQDIHPSSSGSDVVTVWTAPPGTNHSDQVWAPELHRIGDKWYIYVAASNGNNATHRMHVLERDADDPFGAFTYKAQLAATTDRWAIDGTVLQWEGELYFVWSGWPGSSDGLQNLYIAEMENPWTLQGNRVLISTPQYSWEKHGLWINEGPQILIHDDQLHIIYSASGFWTPQYTLGRLTYDGTGSLLDPASWSKASRPVFQAANGVVGVGHASFTTSPDGSEHWIVYHAHRDPPAPPNQELRDIRIQPFTYLANGLPDFGSPLPLGQTIVAPSVGPDAERPFLPGDYNADGAADGHDYGLFQSTFGTVTFPGVSADGNGNGVIDTADYIIWRRWEGTAVAAALESTPAADDLLHAEVIPPPQGPATAGDVRMQPVSQRLTQIRSTNATQAEALSSFPSSRPMPPARPAFAVADRGRIFDEAILSWIESRQPRSQGSNFESGLIPRRDASETTAPIDERLSDVLLNQNSAVFRRAN